MQSLPNPSGARAFMRVKVPEITVLFWVIKVLTTGMGEAAADYLGKVSLALAGLVGVGGFAVAMWWQLRSRRYVPAVYWFAVAMVAVFGTMAADALHIVFHISYVTTTVFYAIVLAAVFTLWRRSEGTLSIHSIVTRRRELFYWLTVLATFALGTACGDLTAATLKLGFFGSAVLFAVLMVGPVIAWKSGLSPIATFWTAYVLTRPLGASIADWLGKPHSFGSGLGYGDGMVTVVAAAAIVVLVAYVSITRTDVEAPADVDDLAPADM
jgi:uncharacterized membrane-anchored protein